MTFLYFAYGSNMLPARLTYRCPSARARGLALVRGYRLAFSKLSKDTSGKAAMIAATGATVPGVLFEIDQAERRALDRHEGVNNGYSRIDDFPVVQLPDGEELLVTTYFATAEDTSLKPFDWYLALVIAGAIHHKLDPEHIHALRAWDHLHDTDLDRDARRKALGAMAAHGIEDFRSLLSRHGP